MNSNRVRKATEVLGLFYTVIFSPDDMVLVKGSPSSRRKYLDILLSQMSAVYLSALQNYRKILKEKNTILKNGFVKKTLLDSYNNQQAVYGSKLIFIRKSFISKINVLAGDFFKKFSREKDHLMLEYANSFSFSSDKESTEDHIRNFFMNLLDKNKDREIERHTALCGPHLDDINIIVNNRKAKIYASEGQKRAVCFALRVAELEMAKRIFKENPVILMDDVFGELDTGKKKLLSNLFDSDIQMFITCTDEKNLNGLVSNAKRYFVDNGVVKK